MLVDVTERHVIPARVRQRRGQHLHVAPQHDPALAAPRRPVDGQMPGQQARHVAVLVGFFRKLIQQRGEFVLKQHVGLGDGHPGGFHVL